MRPADGSELSITPPNAVDDANFKKLVAIIRIAVPYTGMILSTRESPEMRAQLLKVRIEFGEWEGVKSDLVGKDDLRGACCIHCRCRWILAHACPHIPPLTHRLA